MKSVQFPPQQGSKGLLRCPKYFTRTSPDFLGLPRPSLMCPDTALSGPQGLFLGTSQKCLDPAPPPPPLPPVTLSLIELTLFNSTENKNIMLFLPPPLFLRTKHCCLNVITLILNILGSQLCYSGLGEGN